MKVPRDVKADDLIKGFAMLAFQSTRQTGSHARLTLTREEVDYHITVPRHGSLKIGTFNSILNDVAISLRKNQRGSRCRIVAVEMS